MLLGNPQRMLTLYFKPTCFHSQAVLGVAEDLGVSFNLKDVTGDQILQNELFEMGGKDQTPYLVDTDRAAAMYESNEIIDYLYTNYPDGNKKENFGGLRIHKSDEACDTCQ